MMEYEECVQNIHVYKQHIINLPKNINMYSKMYLEFCNTEPNFKYFKIQTFNHVIFQVDETELFTLVKRTFNFLSKGTIIFTVEKG